jgi:hypothetical protein
MKILFSFFLIFLRLWIGYNVLAWLIAEAYHPELHTISEIEIYLVVIIFDTWISKSHEDIDIKIIKKDEN